MSDLAQAPHLYSVEGWSIRRISRKFGRSERTVRAVLVKHKVKIREQGRPPMSEEERQRLVDIGVTCRSWSDYGKKVGIPAWKNPALHRSLGVRLGCFFCQTPVASVTSIRVGPGSGPKPVCAFHEKNPPPPPA